MRVDFIKCHGSGNDFPLIDARGLALEQDEWAQVARALADRSGPVGGDGLLLLTDGDAGHALGFRMWNPDGSESETCLNGLRCVARMGFAALGIDRAGVRLVSSVASVARAADLAGGVYTVRETAGPVALRTVPAELPSVRVFTSLAIPNPHLVTFVEAIDEAELIALGEVCEAAPAWLPQRANVSFVELRGPATLFVRTFERGVGLTDSCGSAMAASTYAACLTGRSAFEVELTVLNRGGVIRATATPDAMVTLSGNATFEWAGSVDVDLAHGAASRLVVTERYPDEVIAWNTVLAGIEDR